jgi:predicted acetyltransferase
VISSFFVANGARRSRIGRAAVTELTAAHPGRWAVAYQERNDVAARFWRKIATGLDRSCKFERHDVPGRPDLPADSWARFRIR